MTTDIAGGNKLFLRDRGSWARFFSLHRLRAGNRVSVERTGEYEYAVSPLSAATDATPREQTVPQAAVHERQPAALAQPLHPTTPMGRFAEFRARVAGLSPPLRAGEVLRPELLIEREGQLAIYYAPMDWVRTEAKVIIVGITPGKNTMKIALETAATGLLEGEQEAVFLDRVKSRASFSGMRTQLVAWLDELDLHAHLGLRSSAELWTSSGERLLHPTSSIRYPVLNDGENYSGSSPTIVNSPMLRRYVKELLSDELAQIPEALIVPLGRRVDEALTWLTAQGAVDSVRILSGFPHPSGANGHRHRQWRENGARLRTQTARWFNSFIARSGFPIAQASMPCPAAPLIAAGESAGVRRKQ